VLPHAGAVGCAAGEYLERSWGLPPNAFAAALSGSLIGLALGAVGLAPLADRFGRRPTLIAMMIVVGLTTLGVALATNPGVSSQHQSSLCACAIASVGEAGPVYRWSA
jgi:MFS family permease